MNNAQKEIFVKMFSIDPTQIVFINDKEDPLFAFWKMVKADTLPESCLIVIDTLPSGTNLDDIGAYGVVRVGRGCVFNYTQGTNVGVKPSQRGLFYRR